MADTSGREEEGFLTCEYGESDDAWLEKNTREIRSRDFERERGEGGEKKEEENSREFHMEICANNLSTRGCLLSSLSHAALDQRVNFTF